MATPPRPADRVWNASEVEQDEDSRRAPTAGPSRRRLWQLAGPDHFHEHLRQWGASASIEAVLHGGVRNDVRVVRIGGRRYVARQSPRAQSAIAWEVDLLLHLAMCGLRVPRPLEAKDGRLHVDGFIVLEWLDGEPPQTQRDWMEAVMTLEHVHAATRTWPQRPGFASTLDLLHKDSGGDVDLLAMPDTVASLVRAAWKPLLGLPLSVVHGDPHAGNIRISSEGVGLIDWDEARVDVSLLDLSDVPVDLGRRMTRESLDVIHIAGDAWETASSWLREPAYATGRLRLVDARLKQSRGNG